MDTGINSPAANRADSLIEDAENGPKLTPEDIIIAVMGITGVGKTSFVNLFSDQVLPVGHGLDSCTQSVEVAPCMLDGTRFFLVDTPGFDDSTRSDSEILREVALWLNQAHCSDIKLAGIIFLHRISDVRVGGSGIRNINTFQKLCGDDCLEGVVLATTMWDSTTEEAGIKREQMLRNSPQLWKRMVDLGSQIYRQDQEKESATKIVKYLVSRKKPLTLDIQREMVDQKLELLQTGAGSELASAVERLIQLYEQRLKKVEQELKEALEKKDQARQELLRSAIEEHEDTIQKNQNEIANLRINAETLASEAKRQHDEILQQINQRHAQELEQQRIIAIKQVRDDFRRGMSPKSCIVM